MGEVGLRGLRVVEASMANCAPRASNRQPPTVPVASASVAKFRCLVRNLKKRRKRKHRHGDDDDHRRCRRLESVKDR